MLWTESDTKGSKLEFNSQTVPLCSPAWRLIWEHRVTGPSPMGPGWAPVDPTFCRRGSMSNHIWSCTGMMCTSTEIKHQTVRVQRKSWSWLFQQLNERKHSFAWRLKVSTTSKYFWTWMDTSLWLDGVFDDWLKCFSQVFEPQSSCTCWYS